MCLIEKIVLFVLIIVLLIDDGVSFESKYKIAKTKDGLVRGQLKKTALNGRSYYSYRGIPFAETPVGDLRFKAPEPSKPWAPKILDAFEYGSACWQPKNEDLATDISEDCLFLNVFVPGKMHFSKTILITDIQFKCIFSFSASGQHYKKITGFIPYIWWSIFKKCW